MNKAKLILPLATLLVLTSCGVKTKEVKTIWGNTWGYTSTVYVGFNINDRELIQKNEKNIDWDKTIISFDDNAPIKYEEKDRTAANILSAEFIRESNYDGIAKQRNFFADNKIVVSDKNDKTVIVGKNKYNDAEERNGVENIYFQNGDSYLMSACDSDGIIQRLTVKHSLDGYTYINDFKIVVAFIDKAGLDAVAGEGFFEILALA